MYIRKFTDPDKLLLRHLLTARDVEVEDSLRCLPETGFAVFDQQFMVAAGFLRRVEGGLGLIDSYVSDPGFDGKMRHEALNLITTALIEEAKKLELRGIVAFSRDQNTICRSLDHGFQAQGHVVVTKDLK